MYLAATTLPTRPRMSDADIMVSILQVRVYIIHLFYLNYLPGSVLLLLIIHNMLRERERERERVMKLPFVLT